MILRGRTTFNRVRKSPRERMVTGAFCKVRSHPGLQTSQALKEMGLQMRAGTASGLTMIAELATASEAETGAAVGAGSVPGALWAMLSGKGAAWPAPGAWQIAAHAPSSEHMPVLPAAGLCLQMQPSWVQTSLVWG